MSDLEPNVFLETLVSDNFVFPGSSIILGASSFHVQLANRMRTKFKVDYNLCPDDSFIKPLCQKPVDINDYGRIEQGMLKEFDVHGKLVTVVLSKMISKKKNEHLTKHASRFFDQQKKFQTKKSLKRNSQKKPTLKRKRRMNGL